MERETTLAEFRLFKLRLHAEQAAWKNYRVALKQWDDTNLSDLTKFREAAHDALTAAVAGFAATNACAACTDKANVMSHLESSIKACMDQFPGKCVDDVLRVNFFNRPMQGPAYSRWMNETAQCISYLAFKAKLRKTLQFLAD